MGLEKAIKSGNEKRIPFKGSKAFDSTCRNHGACSYCEGNRLYKVNKKKQMSQGKMVEYNFSD